MLPVVIHTLLHQFYEIVPVFRGLIIQLHHHVAMRSLNFYVIHSFAIRIMIISLLCKSEKA